MNIEYQANQTIYSKAKTFWYRFLYQDANHAMSSMRVSSKSIIPLLDEQKQTHYSVILTL